VKDFLRNGQLLNLMVGHLTVDSYVGVIPVLFPVLIGRFQLSLATVGLVSLAYSGMASVSQPLFGVLADRFGTRFTGLALCWTALTFALVGFVTSFPRDFTDDALRVMAPRLPCADRHDLPLDRTGRRR